MTCIYPLWARLISMINIIGNPKKDNKRTPKQIYILITLMKK